MHPLYIYIYIYSGGGGGDQFNVAGRNVDLFMCLFIYLSILCKLAPMYLNSFLYFFLLGGWIGGRVAAFAFLGRGVGFMYYLDLSTRSMH